MSAPPPSHFDVIIAGAGTMGSAAAYHLAKRGARVLALDQFPVPHDRGSHHGHSRMIRQAYFEHPDYVPLLRRAYALWDQLQDEPHPTPAGQFFFRTGGLYIGSENGTIVPGSLRAAEEHHLPHSLLGPADLALRFPQCKIDPGHTAFFEAEAGFLVPERAVAAHATRAARLGAHFRTGEPLTSYRPHQTGVTVTTSRASYSADHLILSSGAWTSRIARDLGFPLVVTRQVLAWFAPLGDPTRFAPENFPCWFIETDPPFGHYGFPFRPGDPGLKIALHKPGSPISPDDLQHPHLAPSPAEIDSLHAVFEAHFPGAVGHLTKSATCLYTNSPDGNFVLGPHPHQKNVTLACGFSGHGFKFAPVIGEALADFATQNSTSLPVAFLAPGRFLT